MSAIPRPGTPYPDMPSPSYKSSTLPVRQRAYSSTPIHFALPTLPARTPPSLLNRSASTSSSRASWSAASTPSTPSTPALIAPIARRVSTTSIISSVASPVMPSTPVLETLEAAGPITSLSLPEVDYHPSPRSSGLALPPPVSNWTWKDDVDTRIFNGTSPFDSLGPCDPPSSMQRRPSTLEEVAPKRPKLQRRGTPRPKTTTLQNLAHINYPAYEGKRRLTSVVDGHHWVVLEEVQA